MRVRRRDKRVDAGGHDDGVCPSGTGSSILIFVFHHFVLLLFFFYQDLARS